MVIGLALELDRPPAEPSHFQKQVTADAAPMQRRIDIEVVEERVGLPHRGEAEDGLIVLGEEDGFALGLPLDPTSAVLIRASL